MHRFYADESGVQDGEARLSPEDARHARSVLRLSPGDAVELFSGGGRYDAVLTTVTPDEVVCRVTEALPSTEAGLRITLYQGLPKADKMELIVQKAVELGAERVVPVSMKRCVVQLDAKDGRKKQERWQKIAREASKQSGRCCLMDVACPVSFKECLTLLATHDAAIVPWEDAAGFSLTAFAGAHPEVRSLAVVIGPEGGISPEEVDAMRSVGCLPVTLGPRILRTETAGLAAMSALFCLYGDME